MSKIEWTETTWNPVTGCTKISPGCKNCYAERMAKRLQGMGQAKYRDGFAVRVHRKAFEEPLHWRKPRMIFVCSMGDLFHDDVPERVIYDLFHVMRKAEQHTFQVLTKRPERAMEMTRLKWPPNVWIGTSVESYLYWHRVTSLISVDAAKHFLSLEPLLGPIIPPHIYTWLKIDWAIIGGESGPGARPIDLGWARSIISQCRDSTRVFVKQLGTHWARANGARDAKGSDPSEWPEDLRIREWPKQT